MKENISIQVQIANRTYAIKVNPEEEAGVQATAKFISERLDELQKNHGIKDPQDMLAMFALQYTAEQLKRKSKAESEEEEGMHRVKILQEKLGDYINSL